MEKKLRSAKFLKNRVWKSKIANRLRGRAGDVCQDYLSGTIDAEGPLHIVGTRGARSISDRKA